MLLQGYILDHIRPLLLHKWSPRAERGYNPETPSNFRNNPKATPLDDTPTEAGIGGACHLVKLLWLHPMTDTSKQVETE